MGRSVRACYRIQGDMDLLRLYLSEAMASGLERNSMMIVVFEPGGKRTAYEFDNLEWPSMDWSGFVSTFNGREKERPEFKRGDVGDDDS